MIAEKKLSTGYAELTCPACDTSFHAELGETRMAPGAERVVLEDQMPFTEITQDFAKLLNDYDKGNVNDTRERALALKAMRRKNRDSAALSGCLCRKPPGGYSGSSCPIKSQRSKAQEEGLWAENQAGPDVPVDPS